jgi:choline dehydrogenase
MRRFGAEGVPGASYMSMTGTCDVIIVGAGAAGCVLAARLSEDPHSRVLLLEAGPPDTKTEIRIPAAFNRLFKTEVDWNYTTEPEPQLGGRRLYWPRGRMVGGSSSMNAMMYVRGNPADYDEWAESGCPGWSFADVLPFFRRIERCARGPAGHRGCDGPLPVSELRTPNPMTRAFVMAVQEAGIPRNADINGPDQDGVDFAQVMQTRGARCSAADAYLKPARGRPNLRVVTGAQAARILFEGRRAVGVEYRRDGSTETATATREVVIAGGTINSPQLLMLSGIGDAHHLRELGIPSVHDLPGVGQNLQDHLVVVLVVRSRVPISLAAADSKTNLLRYLLFRRGMLTSNVAEALVFLRSRPEASAPDCELLFAPVPYIDHGLGPPQGHGLSIGAVLLRPASRGRITLQSADPSGAPRIEPRYLSDPDGADLAVLLAAVKQAQRVFSMPSLAPFVGDAIEPYPGTHDAGGLEAFIRSRAETLYHPVGTCRMGSDEWTVVDPELRVRGVERLRVVDASVMPTIIRGHTQAPVMMIAERAAALIRTSQPTAVEVRT